jgi:hypothetical protein
VGGFIYLRDAGPSAEKSFYFNVTFPVNQIMTFTKKETYVYYPGEKKCILIVNRDEISNFNFIEPAERKLDLSTLGLKLTGSRKHDGILTELWTAPAVLNFPFSNMITEKDLKGRLLKFEVRKKDGSILSRLQYSGYKTIEGKEVPMDISSYTAGSRSGIEERFTLKNPVINPKLPEIIRNFKLPDGTKIEKIEMK